MARNAVECGDLSISQVMAHKKGEPLSTSSSYAASPQGLTSRQHEIATHRMLYIEVDRYATTGGAFSAISDLLILQGGDLRMSEEAKTFLNMSYCRQRTEATATTLQK